MMNADVVDFGDGDECARRRQDPVLSVKWTDESSDAALVSSDGYFFLVPKYLLQAMRYVAKQPQSKY